ncbi:hypothetical protein Tco_0897663 [Tanacetum coccineum]
MSGESLMYCDGCVMSEVGPGSVCGALSEYLREYMDYVRVRRGECGERKPVSRNDSAAAGQGCLLRGFGRAVAGVRYAHEVRGDQRVTQVILCRRRSQSMVDILDGLDDVGGVIGGVIGARRRGRSLVSVISSAVRRVYVIGGDERYFNLVVSHDCRRFDAD